MVDRSDDTPGRTSDIVLTDYLSKIVRGWPIVVGALVVFMGAAAAYTATLPRIYQSKALVKVNTSQWSTLPDATLASKWIESESGLLDWMSAADRSGTSYGATPVSDRGGHMEITARSVAPETASEVANRVAESYVKDANRNFIPASVPPVAEKPPAGLEATARSIEARMADGSYASEPGENRLADSATLGYIRNRLQAQMEMVAAAKEASITAQKEQVLLAAIITTAAPNPTPISPSLRLNLAVAAGLALLVSIAFLSVRQVKTKAR